LVIGVRYVPLADIVAWSLEVRTPRRLKE